ncbi:MAG: hypothetical protein AAF907_15900, partial [Planctomycetota bacterium]
MFAMLKKSIGFQYFISEGSQILARRRTRARKKPQADEATEEQLTLDDDGFGSGLSEEEQKPAKRKPARRKTAKSKKDAEPDSEADGEEVVVKKKPAKRKTASKKTAEKKVPAKRGRKKKAGSEEIDLSEFDFGFDDDAPPVPINPAATAAVNPKRSVTSGDDFGGRLPAAYAKNVAAEQLAETLDAGRGQNGGGKKSRRGRRGKKGGGEPQTAPAPRSGGRPAPKPGIGEPVVGVLEMHPKGYGFLREGSNNYVARDHDPFLSGALVDRFRLREGVTIEGEVGPGNRGQGPRVKLITAVDGLRPEEYDETPKFDALTPINPSEQIVLETGQYTVSTRVMDLLTPLGKGQRALIVAPPRSGKTVLLREMADSISTNHPEVHLIVLLIDERPEE